MSARSARRRWSVGRWGAAAMAAAVALGAALAARAAGAVGAPAAPVYTISIGQNEVPVALRTGGANDALAALHYADDDAATFHTFMRSVSTRAYLLSVLDTDSQRRFPDLVAEARVPTQAELADVVDKVKRDMERDRAAGREPVLVFFYSGHGVRDQAGAAGLALHDGALSQDTLYDKILAVLPARVAHVIVDACHAEAVVRPRDVDARVEPLAADELQTYMQTANLRIADARARPQIVVQAPRTDRRAPIVDLARSLGQFRLSGRASGPWAEPFFVETSSGVRLADVFAERDAPIALRLPAGESLYLVRPDGEVEIAPRAGEAIALADLPAAAPRARARGALDDAMRKGLFATAFGSAFYRGYVSQQQDLVAVDFPEEIAAADRLAARPADSAARTAGRVLLWTGVAAAAAAGVFGGLAYRAESQYNATDVERTATEARGRFYLYRDWGLATGAGALALVGAGLALSYWPHAAAAGPEPAPAPARGIAFTGSGFVFAGSF